MPQGISVELPSKPVTATFDGAFYIEEPDRSSGIRVLSSQTVVRGNLVKVACQSALDGAERSLQAESVTIESSKETGAPNPLTMPVKSLGGNDFYYSAAPEPLGQQGITGGFGVSNIGLLVRTSGTATQVASSSFLLEGVKVIVPAGVNPPQQGKVVLVTGISSCESVGGEVHRLLRVRDQSDIVEF